MLVVEVDAPDSLGRVHQGALKVSHGRIQKAQLARRVAADQCDRMIQWMKAGWCGLRGVYFNGGGPQSGLTPVPDFILVCQIETGPSILITNADVKRSDSQSVFRSDPSSSARSVVPDHARPTAKINAEEVSVDYLEIRVKIADARIVEPDACHRRSTQEGEWRIDGMLVLNTRSPVSGPDYDRAGRFAGNRE